MCIRDSRRGVRELAGVAARSAAGDAGEVDLAAVRREAVAVGEARGAGADGAGARGAHRRGVGQRAGLAAAAAVRDVRGGGGLAAVGRVDVAVEVADVAGAEPAVARDARGRGVGDDAGVAAGAAVRDVRGERDLAAVADRDVAVGVVRGAGDGGAGAAHAGAGVPEARDAGVAGGAAVGVRGDVELAAVGAVAVGVGPAGFTGCLLYTSPSPRD